MERVITYFQHEEILARMERSNRRLWILCIILIFALLGSNIGWVYYESQFEKFEIQQEASSEGGGNAFVNNGGDFNYGTCETND